MPEPDLGDQLLEPEPPVARGARAARGPRRRPRPTPAGQPSSTARSRSAYCRARRLDVALDLRQRRLAHIHDRAPPPMRLGDLAAAHSSRSASTNRASSRASRTVTSR